jgi:hypothetical protein
MKTININGSDYTVEELTKILEEAKKASPMEEVYKYHNTTEKDFEELYKNLPLNVKYHQKEVMIVKWYNKDWKPNLKDSNQKKWYGWFYLDEFRFLDSHYLCDYSLVPASLLLKDEKSVLDMKDKFLKELKDSRTTLPF